MDHHQVSDAKVHVFSAVSAAPHDQGGTALLLLHGKTWSSGPVWHLEYGEKGSQEGRAETVSFIERMAGRGLSCYAMDFRGFGKTADDGRGGLAPNTAVEDTEAVIHWLQTERKVRKVVLAGWSQGALVAQMVAQRNEQRIGGLILYGSIYTADPDFAPPAQLFSAEDGSGQPSDDAPLIPQTVHESMGDFTVPGSISPDLARTFGEGVVAADPGKRPWRNHHQFRACNPTLLPPEVPVLLIHGSRDPYVDKAAMAEMFLSLRTEAKSYVVVPDADHPVHLLFGERDQGLGGKGTAANRFEDAVFNFVTEP